MLGRGETVGQELAGNPKVAMVSMTGSVAAGEKLWPLRRNITKVCLELGGKAPAIVMDDADLELAVKAVVDSRVINTGQCVTASSGSMFSTEYTTASSTASVRR